MIPRLVVLTALFAAIVIGCGGRPEPAAPSAPPAPEVSAEPSAEPPPTPKKRKPFELHNACGDVATVALGADPKSADAGKRTVAPGADIELPRDDEGNQTVWLLDANGEPLLEVRVTRGMKRVEIGRSCRTLDAR